MTLDPQPMVSVVTPVYNGALYLRECIESVLAQTYSNWDYTIVNNCSTDESLNIAEQCAAMDERIRVVNNEQFLDIIANHNKAFRLISPNSKYCKVLSADDWLFPECLARMVRVAETNPSVGVVGSYQLSGGGADWKGWRVRWAELPYPSTVIPGRRVCRARLLGGPHVSVFGAPTSIMYRADLVRIKDCFYPNPSPDAPASACYEFLLDTDYGFVHQVLSYERVHPQAISELCRSLNSYKSSHLRDVVTYGPNYLTPEELNKVTHENLTDYYDFLATTVLHSRDKGFWTFHKQKLAELGHPLSFIRLAEAVSLKVLDLLLNPKRTAENVIRRVARAWRNTKSPRTLKAAGGGLEST